jgi:hypothetical protein
MSVSKKNITYVQRKVLVFMTLKIFVFWGVMPDRLVEHHQHFGGTCCLKLHFRSTLKMEATGSSKTVATFPPDYIPEDSNLLS